MHVNLLATECFTIYLLDILQVADGIYQHVDVREEGKENAFSLGHTLWINNEVSCCLFHAARPFDLFGQEGASGKTSHHMI